MQNGNEMKIIAHVRTDFPEKFGVPRQSGLADNLATIVFEKDYRTDSALRGIEMYSHLWIIWKFSENDKDTWSPTVRPPRLGGNTRMGVFATRSPFRPNPIGLSSVRLVAVEKTDCGTVLVVQGADLVDMTPVFDIKPYLAYTDSHPEAVGGFADSRLDYHLNVDFPDELLSKLPEDKRSILTDILSQDPRPAYIDDAERIYGLSFARFEIKFSVRENTLFVISVKERDDGSTTH